MTLLRILLATLTLIIYATTILIMLRDGTDFLTPYFTALFSGTWQGQFNLDFGMYLFLSALWIMWRGGFSVFTIAIGLLAGLLGMLVFAPYVLWLTYRENSDLRKLVLGVHDGARPAP